MIVTKCRNGNFCVTVEGKPFYFATEKEAEDFINGEKSSEETPEETPVKKFSWNKEFDDEQD